MKDYIFSLLQSYGDPILFLALVAEFLGVPFIPGEPMLLFMGFLGSKGSYQAIFYSICFATAGTFAGSMIAWFIGYRFGERVVLKFSKPLHLTKEKLELSRVSFEKHQGLFIIFSRFVPGVRHVIPYISGLSRINAQKYAVLNMVGSVFWCTFFVTMGALLGERWGSIARLTMGYSLVIILLFLFIYVTVKVFKKHQKIIFAIAIPLLIFIKISEDTVKNELAIFDGDIYLYTAQFITRDLTDFMKILTSFGSAPVLIVITIIVITSLYQKERYRFYCGLIGANLVATTLLNELFKLFFHRERPEILRLIDITGYSFPSGHSMIGLCFYGYFAYIICANMKSRWRYPLVISLVLLIILIGLSRIYLGVHYASDVFGGFFAGMAWLSVFITLSNRMHKKYCEY